MVKIVTIQDLHGKNCWKDFLTLGNFYIFLGDYLDSKEYHPEEMIDNLLEIIELKKSNPDNVILLLGNHDIQYLFTEYNIQASGYNYEYASIYNRILSENEYLFQYAYQKDDYIFSHAGIQHNWFVNSFKGDINSNIADQINKCSIDKLEILFDIGKFRGGKKNVGGIFWCDKSELKKPLKGFHQIVGHSKVKEFKKIIYKNSSVVFTDLLSTIKKPYITEW